MKVNICHSLLFAIPCFLLAGCGGPADANTAVAGENSAASTSAAAPAAESADAAVRYVVDGLLEHQPERVWDSLPPSYKTDIDKVVGTFAEKLDADVYDRGFSLVARLGEVLHQKKDLFLASDMFPEAVDRGDAAANWDSFTTVIRTLSTSEIARLENLASLDMQQFLGSTGKTLLQEAERAASAAGEDLFEHLRNLQIEVIDSGNGESTLRLSSGDFSQEVDWVRVEERWVPRELADEWSTSVAEILGQIEGISKDDFQAMKPQILGAYGMVEGVISQLESAESVQQLDQILQMAMFSVLGMFMGSGGMPGMDFQVP